MTKSVASQGNTQINCVINRRPIHFASEKSGKTPHAYPTISTSERRDLLNDETQNLLVQEIARCQPRLRAFARCLRVRQSDVDDVLQEVNAVLWEKS